MSPACGQPNDHFARRSDPALRGMTRAGRRTAFTLIELLVVLGIIALVLAIILPSFAAARHQARRVQCQANLKQIVFGWHSYLLDSKGYFPRGVMLDFTYGGVQRGGTNSSNIFAWPRPLNKHLGMAPVLRSGGETFFCPSETGDAGTEGMYTPIDEGPYFTRFGSSYRTNPLMVAQLPIPFSPGQWNGWLSRRLNHMLESLNTSQIKGESKLVLVGDGCWYKAWNPSWEPDPPYWHEKRWMYNIGFMDGHADFIKIQKGRSTTSDYTVIPFASLQHIFNY